MGPVRAKVEMMCEFVVFFILNYFYLKKKRIHWIIFLSNQMTEAKEASIKRNSGPTGPLASRKMAVLQFFYYYFFTLV
jgi:hypothetical protein